MENTPVKSTFIETELKKFETEYEITETGLIDLASKYQNLTVNGIDDKEGLKAVESARKELKNERVKIEKVSKGMRDSAVKFQKAVIAREKELVAIIQPQEDRLMAIEDAIWQEKERLREEAEKKESDRIQAMLDQLSAVNYAIDFHTLKGMTDEQFDEVLEEATFKFEDAKRLEREEQERLAEIRRHEEIERKAEEERLAREREAFEKQQAAFREEQERIQKYNDEVRKKLEEAEQKLQEEKRAREEQKLAEERERQRQQELEQAKKEAAEKARIEAEQRAALEAKQKLEREQREKEEAEEKLLAGADKAKFEKLQHLISTNFLDEKVIIWLHFKSKKGKVASARVKDLLAQAHQICVDNV